MYESRLLVLYIVYGFLTVTKWRFACMCLDVYHTLFNFAQIAQTFYTWLQIIWLGQTVYTAQTV